MAGNRVTTPHPTAISCPACGETLHVSGRFEHGERARCSKCRKFVSIHRTPDTLTLEA